MLNLNITEKQFYMILGAIILSIGIIGIITALEIRTGIKLYKMWNKKESLRGEINHHIGQRSKFILFFYKRRSKLIRDWMRDR